MYLTPNEVVRLKAALDKVPPCTTVILEEQVLSEFGRSIIMKFAPELSIDLTEMDNF